MGSICTTDISQVSNTGFAECNILICRSNRRYGTPIGGCFPVKGGGGATWIVTKRGGGVVKMWNLVCRLVCILPPWNLSEMRPYGGRVGLYVAHTII